MSNFQELQAEKKDWSLASDEKLFEKLKHLENNVIASTHLVHNSLNELNKAFNASHTNLHNTINTFNQLSFNKFVENVVEEKEAGEGLMGSHMGIDQTTMIGSLRSEDEKLTEALKIAYEEVTQAREERKEAKAA
jgi:hypothetical protein